jgi:hypothetical protein
MPSIIRSVPAALLVAVALSSVAVTAPIPTAGARSGPPLPQLQNALNAASRAARRHHTLPPAAYARIRRLAIAADAALPDASWHCRAALHAAKRLPHDRHRRARILTDLRRAQAGLTACRRRSHQHTTTTDNATTTTTTGSTTTTPPTGRPTTPTTSAVTGSVHWPNGDPAANTPLTFFPQGYSLDELTPSVTVQTDATGAYALTECPCQALVGWLMVPENHSPDAFNGGRDCWILMGTDDGTTGGVSAQPPAQLDWNIPDWPCSSTPYNPSDAASVVAALQQQQQDPNDQPDVGYAGTWQDARARIQ